MDVGTFNVTAETPCRRINQGKGPVPLRAWVKLTHNVSNQGNRQREKVPTNDSEGVVKTIPIVFDSGGTKPRTGRSSPFGFENTSENDGKSKCTSSIQHGLHIFGKLCHCAHQGTTRLGGWSTTAIAVSKPSPLIMLRCGGFFAVSRLSLAIREVTLCHPWLSGIRLLLQTPFSLRAIFVSRSVRVLAKTFA
jgi:hypothetical protein